MMLIYFIGIFLIFGVNAEIIGNSRARRFCCGNNVVSSFESISSGGRAGCVVSDNKLYVNGIFTKDLTSEELQELDQYKKDNEEYRNNTKKYFEQQFNYSFGEEKNEKEEKDEKEEKNNKLNKAPIPPKKPSFCQDKARTQFIFNGCMVQGDSLYIGNNFVRKLTGDEQKELEQFDDKLSEYQKDLTEQINQQVSESFGKSFGRFFGKKPYEFDSESNENESKDSLDNSNTSTLPAERKQKPDGSKNSKLEMPKPPEFCTVIA